jgi:hypothetical protein
MTGATIFPIQSGAAVPSLRRLSARVEKICGNNGLRDDYTDNPYRRDGRDNPSPPKTASRIDTGPAPRWYGPRHSSAFAAQILGQVMTQGAPDAASARTAYAGADNGRRGRALDREI